MATNQDKFMKVTPNIGWQIGGSGVADASVTTITLNAVTNLPTDTAVEITIDRVDSSGNKTPSKMERVIGVVSGLNIINCLRGVEGTAQAHAAGAIVEVNISATNWNRIAEGILVEHNQDGTHKASSMEWVPLTGTLTATTATTISTSVDLTSTIQKGDKIKLINNSTTKYFYVVSLTSTVLTVTGEVDLVAGAITSPYYSKIENPQGFKLGEIHYKVLSNRSTNITGLISGYNKVTLNNETIDVNNNFNTTTGTYTAPISGDYVLNFSVGFQDAITSGTTFACIYVNGVEVIRGARMISNDGDMISNGARKISLTKGNTVELYVYTATAGRVVFGSSAVTFLDIQFISI